MNPVGNIAIVLYLYPNPRGCRISPKGIMIAKIFELNQSVLAISLDNCIHELINKVIILLSCKINETV